MKLIIILFTLTVGIYCSTKAPSITREPRTVVYDPVCPNSICEWLTNGDYGFTSSPGNIFTYNNIDYFDYYYTCAEKTALCRPCAEENTFYVQQCGQCLTKERIEYGECHITKPTGTPLPRPICPSKSIANIMCSSEGAEFCGNLRDFRINNNNPTPIYIGCWMGTYVNCMFCNPGLVFFQKKKWGSNDYDNWGFCEKRGYTVQER